MIGIYLKLDNLLIVNMFKNREEAGNLLAKHLHTFSKRKGVLVLGIARGGMVVAKKTSSLLNLLLDVIVIKKIGSPTNPELAIGAVGPRNTVYWDKELCEKLGISTRIKNHESGIMNQERIEREKILRRGKRRLDIKNKTAILVDDGVATGATVLCAQKFLKKESAKKIILATPVISKETYRHIARYFDKVITLAVEDDFYAVGQFYREFPQVSDKEVISLLSS